MSAYKDFAYYYDLFNGAANYDKLTKYIKTQLQKHHIFNGIVADLGCGTGELTLQLSDLGYDMIAIDSSAEMLSLLNNKKNERKILLLNQQLQQLDLYGTINAAVSTFDTLNHIGPASNLEKAIEKISLFLEQNGIFIFDVNTLYKHEEVLANNTFVFQDGDIECEWINSYNPHTKETLITIKISNRISMVHQESFKEYYYSHDFLEQLLEQYHLDILECLDGETFEKIAARTERYIYVVQRR